MFEAVSNSYRHKKYYFREEQARMVCSRGRLLLPIGPGRDARARATNPTLPFFMITIESKNSKNINTCETEVFNYQMDGSKG